MKFTVMLLSAFCSTVAMHMLGPPVLAEPAPPPPFEAGRYSSPWGMGQFSTDGINGQLILDDGSVLWGPLTNNRRSWDGRWVRSSGSVTAAGGFRKCTSRRANVPSSFPVPASDIWGRFSGQSGYARDSGARAIFVRWAACNDNIPGFGADAGRNFVATRVAASGYVAAPVTVTVPTFPYDGPCAAISQTAVAYVSPCRLEPFRPLKVTMRKDIQKGTRRLIYTALSDDTDAVLLAIRNNSVLPRNANGATAYSVGPTVKLKLRGDTGNFTPSGQLCRHRFWAVSLLDGANVEHKGLGIISLNCSGRSDPPLEDRPLERVGKITPRGE